MKPRLKKISDQVMVITGASSGIGLATAREAAARGARLVLTARNQPALKQIAAELASRGCEAIPVAADVGEEKQVRRVALAALQRFGGFDTWVNNAGISIFGPMEAVSGEDRRRLFDTNFWGVVHGSLAAVEHLNIRGGALINIGAEACDMPLPLQGFYAASKHAVKGFTDSLRVELAHQRSPVSVTLINPAGVDTLYVEHAKSYLECEPRLPAPVYGAEIAARAILHAAAHPEREIFVGGAAKLFSTASRFAPGLLGRYLRWSMFRQQQTRMPALPGRTDALHGPVQALKQGMGRRVLHSSAYTSAALHPACTAAVALGSGLLLGALWRVARRG